MPSLALNGAAPVRERKTRKVALVLVGASMGPLR